MPQSLERRIFNESASAARQRRRLLVAMGAAVLLISVLALWDQAHEADAALRDFTLEQVSIARVAAHGLALRSRDRRATEQLTFEDFRSLLPEQTEPSAQHTLALVLPPGGATLFGPDTRRRSADRLLAAMRRGAAWLRLEREEAGALGLPKRTAIAGIATVDDATTGPWQLAIVTSAAAVRDRGSRATWRFLLSVGTAIIVVTIFGSAALRTQRAQFELERALVQAELGRERTEQLEREGRAATMLTLAAGVAHEVSTPLGVISGRAEQLLQRGADRELEEARVQRSAKAIVEQTKRIDEVVHGFLRLARGDALVLELIAPAAIVELARALVEYRFAKVRVELRVEADTSLPHVRGDALLLQNALVNLLVNACDACEPGADVVLRVQADERTVQFAVEDNGSGISEADMARVSEPFFSTKLDKQGTGIGLAVTKEIVSLHRGTFTLSTRLPRGSRAVIALPIEESLV